MSFVTISTLSKQKYKQVEKKWIKEIHYLVSSLSFIRFKVFEKLWIVRESIRMMSKYIIIIVIIVTRSDGPPAPPGPSSLPGTVLLFKITKHTTLFTVTVSCLCQGRDSL